ncbi:MAG: flagellar basal-body rod protein FlgG [Actinomycetota bacterium]|nr:flagellar basal-body rod protein FlgG [Actinomycetota bacterium]
MFGAFWVSASGLLSQRAAVDVLSNNIANINTVSYKKNAVQFKDLIYQRVNAIGEFEPNNSSRTGILMGTGTQVSSMQKVFSQGGLEQTDNPYDIAIIGNGFFQVLLPDGTLAYTRDGSFKVDSDGSLVTAQGYKVEPPIKIPEGSTNLTISPEGKVSVVMADTGQTNEIGNISLYYPPNPDGLLAIGENLYLPTVASGKMVEQIGDQKTSELRQGFLERSNVELSDEMTQLIIAQRAYQLNAQALQAADEMLQAATNIRG